MQNSMFMTIIGSTQGLISEGAFTPDSVGNIYQNGHEDEISIETFNYGSSIPINIATGQPNGQRILSPLSIVKLLDKSSPLLSEALNNGETLKKVEIKAYRTSYMGREEHFYTIILEDAIITNINATNTKNGPTEHVTFSYRKRVLRHEIASTSSSDDIRTGVNV
ncbi:Hcp family type VI secretion system effector [Sulfurimonas sp.]|uniref:Hcp family type VI secretion system effector n=1 Tax=Sulfurimonas sp. TaxID=2022749 RepID=UPI002B4849AA|nr:Hcp family type VI secretion system effector [Sulfurimonas sp.]